MSRLALRITAAAAVIALLGLGSYAVAGGGSKSFSASPLSGYEENPDISTHATGSFKAQLGDDGGSLHWQLSYSGIEGGNVLQSHIHFGKRAVNGGISIFLCTNLNTATTDDCPQSGTISGVADRDDVVGPAGQGIAAGELEEILAAMRAGHAYVNVHTQTYPGGEIRAQIDDGRGGDDHHGEES